MGFTVENYPINDYITTLLSYVCLLQRARSIVVTSTGLTSPLRKGNGEFYSGSKYHIEGSFGVYYSKVEKTAGKKCLREDYVEDYVDELPENLALSLYTLEKARFGEYTVQDDV